MQTPSLTPDLHPPHVLDKDLMIWKLMALVVEASKMEGLASAKEVAVNLHAGLADAIERPTSYI